ncbi:MAG: YhcH/YjgK/YiaL family protein [Lentisphaeria bacterium]|nr:YhcH/YjgK/YiaL family protein [Lentisphaeria bacterium]
MIFDSLKNFAKYSVFTDDATKKISEFIAKADLNLPIGRNEIDGDKLFASVQSYTTRDLSASVYEVHHEYVDIQLILAGEESIYYTTDEKVEETKAYAAEGDCALYAFKKETATMLNLQVGDFAVFLPYELHMPCVDSVNGKKEIRKIVVKIHKSLLK